MPNLTPDHLLSTTRSVRKRLDFSRPVEMSLIRECLDLAIQAPSGSNSQGWHFVVVTDAAKRLALAGQYRKGWEIYRALPQNGADKLPTEEAARNTQLRVADSASYLAEHMHEVPVMLIPCILGRQSNPEPMAQASMYGSILPAAWSFMLAARARGLGTCWTTIHLMHEQACADILGIPFAKVTQCALIPVAHTLGDEFKPAPRKSLEALLHLNGW